jgi:SPP1 family predicted phage head-tail adaptor
LKLKDKKIQIFDYSYYTDDNGFGIEEWRPIHSGRLWAYYRQLSGKEFFAAATVNQTEDVVFTINWRADLTTDMIIKYNGRYYNITRIDDFEGYKRDLNVYCKLNADQELILPED